ncbi:hypothetical protein [Brachybacterium sp. NPDC056505]
MAIPDLTTYQDPEVLTPPDDPEPCSCRRLTCRWCGDEAFLPSAHDPTDD